MSGIALSPPDIERFGVQIARGWLKSLDDIDTAIEFCNAKEVSMLVARCNAEDVRILQKAAHNGFELMDTLVYYSIGLNDDAFVPEDTSVYKKEGKVRMMQNEDVSAIANISQLCFKGYFDHYHADPLLNSALATEAYQDWARRIASSVAEGDPSVRMIVCEDSYGDLDCDQIAGFLSIRLNNPEEGEIVLNGVHPKAQGRGIYTSMFRRAVEIMTELQLKKLLVSTHIQNYAVQKVWSRCGLLPITHYYTFHKWFRMGKVVVIAGGGLSDICLEMAILLQKQGHQIAIFGNEIEEGNMSTEFGFKCFKVDLSDEREVIAALKDVEKVLGCVNAVVSCVSLDAISDSPSTQVLNLALAEFKESKDSKPPNEIDMYDTYMENIASSLRGVPGSEAAEMRKLHTIVRSCISFMRKGNPNRKSRVINMLCTPSPCTSASSFDQYTKYIAHISRPFGITSNLVVYDSNDIGESESMCETIKFIISDQSDFVSAATFDGRHGIKVKS